MPLDIKHFYADTTKQEDVIIPFPSFDTILSYGQCLDRYILPILRLTSGLYHIYYYSLFEAI